jgi:DNA-damage-inducible protein J
MFLINFFINILSIFYFLYYNICFNLILYSIYNIIILEYVLRLYIQYYIILLRKQIILLEGVLYMAKSANLYARIEPDLKENAEAILNVLGISASIAITMFYKQIVMHNGIPFELKIPNHPLDINKITEDEFNKEIEKGLQDVENGNTIPAKEVFASIRNKYDI